MRKTKIICTLGPSTKKDGILRELMLNGMNTARINFSHGTREAHLVTINEVKKMREELNLPVAILLDTSGPEIRLGNFIEGKAELCEGELFTLTSREVEGTKDIVSITYKGLPGDVSKGTIILIDDGLIKMEAEEVTDTDIVCRILNGGTVSDHKGVNVPNVNISMPYISEKDRLDIIFGIENDVDYIAASFVRSADDVLQIRKIFEEKNCNNIKIISKIENRQGVDNIDEILNVSDGIMIARGDMGVEIPLQEVPVIQKKIIHKVYNADKIVITATQMLESMMKNPRPTRAEATDVANAIYDGTSAIMLSGETAAGNYPVEALKTMTSITECAEEDINYDKRFKVLDKMDEPDVTDAISHATCMTAIDINAAAIITITKSGGTARLISRYRPYSPIIGCTPSKKTYYQMGLSWGVMPVMIKEETDTEELFKNSMKAAQESGYIEKGGLAVITAGVPLGISGTTNIIRVIMAE
ncbi:MAG: pyruvate kinase [Lachnospiraceae bacterium]